MSSLRKRHAVMEAIALKFLEEGKVLDRREYDNCANVPVRSRVALQHVGSWARLVSIMKQSMPEVFEQIAANTKPKEELDPLAKLARRTA